jgi:uncharacterized protein YbjT (DUF2867 family)
LPRIEFMIVVTGATGRLGGGIAKRLVDACVSTYLAIAAGDLPR